MIKTETKEVTEIITTEKYFCDICGQRTMSQIGCCNCGKHICKDHTTRDCYDTGDYPDKYCPECWSKYEEYKTVEEQHEKILEKEYDRIMKGITT